MTDVWEKRPQALRELQEEGTWVQEDGEIYFQKFPMIKYLRGGT